MNKIINTPIFVSSDGSRYHTSPTTMLVFVDETGDETVFDPNYPVFGFGGCCVLAGEYYSIMDAPLNRICRQYSISRPLHACSGRKKKVKRVLQGFFENQRFGRFAVIVSNKTNFSTWSTERTTYTLIQTYLANLFNSLGLSETLTDIAFIQEDSFRLIPKLEKIIQSVSFSRGEGEMREEIKVRYFKISKEAAMVGIEIADRIAYVAGTTVRDCHRGIYAKPLDNADFMSIFGSINPAVYSKFINISNVEFDPLN